MPALRKFFRGLRTDGSGVSSVEYALLLAFIAGAIIVAANQLANSVGNEMTGAADCITSSGATC